MSLLKGNLDSNNMFTVHDQVRGVRFIAPGAVPSFLGFESANGTDYYLFPDDSGNLRYHTSPPTSSSPNSTGTAIAGVSTAECNRTLSNLGTVAINESIQSDSDLGDDCGD